MRKLLRRYWWPVGFSDHLKNKLTFIRLLGEDLVLFRHGNGRPGVLGALCSHRRVNLCLGNVTKNGLSCRYHGWMYDIDGKVLETPGEPQESKLKEIVHHLSYPVEELGGLVFAYLANLCRSCRGSNFWPLRGIEIPQSRPLTIAIGLNALRTALTRSM